MARIETRDDRTVFAAATRVLDAGERLVKGRVDLTRLELRGEVERTVRGSTLAIAGLLLAYSGWAVLMAALVLALAPVVAPAVSMAVIGGLHLGAGLLLARAGTAHVPARQTDATDPLPGAHRA